MVMINGEKDYNLKERKRKGECQSLNYGALRKGKRVSLTSCTFSYFCCIIDILSVTFHTTQCAGPTEHKMKRKEGGKEAHDDSARGVSGGCVPCSDIFHNYVVRTLLVVLNSGVARLVVDTGDGFSTV